MGQLVAGTIYLGPCAHLRAEIGQPDPGSVTVHEPTQPSVQALGVTGRLAYVAKLLLNDSQ